MLDPGLGTGEAQELIHQAGALAYALEDGPEGLVFLGRFRAAQAKVHLGLEHREGGAELVGGVGDEAAAHGHLGIQPLDVAVDGFHQGLELLGHRAGIQGLQGARVAASYQVTHADDVFEAPAQGDPHQYGDQDQHPGFLPQAGCPELLDHKGMALVGLGHLDDHGPRLWGREDGLGIGHHAHRDAAHFRWEVEEFLGMQLAGRGWQFRVPREQLPTGGGDAVVHPVLFAGLEELQGRGGDGHVQLPILVVDLLGDDPG